MTRLLFLGLNFAPEEIGIGLYSGELVDAWVAAGNQAHVVTTYPYYPQWKRWPGFSGGWSSEIWRGAHVVRCPIYIPRVPSGTKRILHYLTFAAAGFFPTLFAARSTKPEVVMTVAPSLIAAPIAWLASRLVGARSWLHIQDFEVEAAGATGLVSRKGLGMRAALSVERWILRRFDVVSTISPQMRRKLVEKGVAPDRIVELRNWANLDAIRPEIRPSPYRDEWNITTPHVALYSGNIANKQGIEIVIEAARLLADREDLTFVICGEGPNRARLESEAADLPNVRIHDLQPRERLSELLGMASVHLLPQKGDAADLVLPSKLTNMLASGRPVIATSAPGTGLFDEVEGVGTVTPPDDAAMLASALTDLLDSPDKRGALGAAARLRAEDRWSKTAIIKRFIDKASGRRIGAEQGPRR